jgi:O-antigen/teichoic acid export membrane protein
MASILTPVIANVMQVTLGMLNEFSALAVFGIGKTLSNVVLILGTSFKSALFPSFLKKTDSQDIGYALTDSIRYMLLVSVFLAFLIHTISSPLILSFYTAEYTESSIIFEILSYGILFSTVFIGLTPATISSGRPDIRVMVDVINTIVLVTLAILLIPGYSALGAAVALTSGLVVGTTVFAFAAFRYLRYAFPWKTLIKCIIAGAVAVIPLQFINLAPVYQIITAAGLGSVLYVLILYLMREIKEEDTKLVQASVKEIMKYLKEVVSGNPNVK